MPETELQEEQEAQEPKIETTFDPGELAPCWHSSYPNIVDEISDEAAKWIKRLCDLVGNRDIAARRFEVEQSWEARLFYRGYQYLLPRKGGGWILPPFATSYDRQGSPRGSQKFYGYETNMYTTYGEIVQAALTRDVPHVRFEPQDPENDADITAADRSSDYARVFMRNNDLKDFQQQLANYLWTDGRAIIICDHVLNAQRFGRDDEEEENAPVPETEASKDQPILYLIRHGETAKNLAGQNRGRSDVGLDGSGEREIQNTAEWLRDKGITEIVASPVERAQESAQELSQALGVPVTADDRLASLDIGTEMVGEKKADTIPQMEEAFENPDEPIGGDGETPNQFQSRVKDALFALVQQAGAGQLAAVVTHDSVIGQCFKLLLGENTSTTGLIEPGGVAAVYPSADGTLRIEVVFPVERPAPPTSQKRGRPRGKELVYCGGKLEGKVPMNTMEQSDMPFIEFSREYDVAYVKAMFPEKASEIEPGGSSSGENELDRIARINASLALEASYVTGDSMVRDCTIQRFWFRPGFFMEVSDDEVREELMTKFPDGAHVILAGSKACMVVARNESMDDHVTVLHASPGSGQNRMALGTKLISLQKRVNNWVDIMNAFFIKTVPMKWLPSKLVSQEAQKDTANNPGQVQFYELSQVPPQQTFQSLMAIEPVPEHQPVLPEFIKSYLEDLPQLFSHALPSLFGANANTDTVGGIAIQRDQALGCLGTPWHSIQVATCNYFRQAVQLAARCRTKPIVGSVGKSAVRIELTDLKGNIMVYPEQDANFPESWLQKQQRYQQVITDASNPAIAPFLAGILQNPRNQKAFRDAVGIEDFCVPDAESYDKQLGEFDLLLKTAPVPNQKKIAMERQLQQMVMAAGTGQAQVPPEQIQQLQQQVEQMPDMVSSVPVDPTVDRHSAESAACQDWLNSPDGRKFHYGTPQQRDAYQNVRLHKQEHDQFIEPPTHMDTPKPSVNFKDLPPDAAAKILQSMGLETSGPDVVQTREFGALIKKSGKVGGPPVPGMQ